MYSSEDLERFYFQYQTEALPHGESLQSFCVKNKVPYNIFQKWYRSTINLDFNYFFPGIPVPFLILGCFGANVSLAFCGRDTLRCQIYFPVGSSTVNLSFRK